MAQLGEEFKEQHQWVSSYLPQGNINLERILTQLDLELQDKGNTGKRTVLEERVSDIKTFLRKRLGLDQIGDSQIKKAKTLCSKLFMDKDSIITFNYDCLLEHILWRLNFWSPNGGYGQSPNLNDLSSYGSQIKQNPKDILILKLHSSLNFQKVQAGGDAHLQPWISKELFPGINANWNKQPQIPPIVLPSFVKIFGENRTLIYIWHEAIEKLRKAEIIVVIGYSLPRSDAMTRFLLSFISADDWTKQGIKKLRIGILNKGSDANGVLKQIIEVGQFEEEDIEHLVLEDGSDEDYGNLCSWCRQAR
jgi:hypothetical protein